MFEILFTFSKSNELVRIEYEPFTRKYCRRMKTRMFDIFITKFHPVNCNTVSTRHYYSMYIVN